MCFNFFFCFFSSYFYRNYEFWNWIKNLCNNIAGIKKYKLIIKKTKKKHDKMVLLAKPRFNSIEILFSKALSDSVISHDEFVLINNFQN